MFAGIKIDYESNDLKQVKVKLETLKSTKTLYIKTNTKLDFKFDEKKSPFIKSFVGEKIN